MISDSITNASATAAPSARDFGKKKRTNRSAKLKQSKLGLRREQWLSQVAMINKGDKEEMDTNRRIGSEKTDQRLRDRPVENLDGQRREEEKTHRHESFIESLSNSPNSILSGMNSIPNFSSSSSSGSGGSCSGNITEEEDADADDDGCLDDWEAIADALAADDEKHEKENPPESFEEHENIKEIISGSDVAVRDAKPDSSRTMSRKQKSNQAWRPDDKLRPQGLPNLEKQRSFPVMNLHFSSVAVPSSCPICYEDLDLTDSNFLPCPCGFRLCLFCHKTICDGDGRCPGCRKPYERNTVKVEASVQGGGLTIRLARSSSMFCRS